MGTSLKVQPFASSVLLAKKEVWFFFYNNQKGSYCFDKSWKCLAKAR